MEISSAQHVLRCGLCNKPFDTPSTLKRHGYYCRSRKTGNAPRSRSCISCARRKARCDNKRPDCSRCKVKRLECHYLANTEKPTRSSNHPGDEVPTKRRKTAIALVPGSRDEIIQDASSNGEMRLDGALTIPEAEFANLEGEYLDWDYSSLDLSDVFTQQLGYDTDQYPSWQASSLVRHSPPSIDQTFQLQQIISASNLSIPPTLPVYSPRSLLQRPKPGTGTHRTANLILHTLKSYVLMMLHNNTPPPFIHQRLISPDFECDFMEPLNNAISLVHMINSGVRGSQKLFWKNVRQECERLIEVHSGLSRWELLAAMQALSIYIIIRLDQGETDHNNFDILLITTVIVISKRFSEIKFDTQVAPRSHNLESSWGNWIFDESSRRLCVVFQVVNMLVYFEPAALCDHPTDVLIAPLPAKKHLWEASDEFVWKAETESESGVQTNFGLAANGDLVTMDQGQLFCHDALPHPKNMSPRTAPRITANWANWSSGMDSFGGLVMLAASLKA